MMFSTFSKSVVKQTLTPPFEIRFFSFSKNKRPKTYVVSGKVIKVFFFLHLLLVMCKSKTVLSFCSWALDSKTRSSSMDSQ